jgi:hypothetical protein
MSTLVRQIKSRTGVFYKVNTPVRIHQVCYNSIRTGGA